jgi:hypothetical protein
MLIIREAQMEAFAAEARRDLAWQLLTPVRASLAARVAGLSDEELAIELERCVEHAERHGFSSPREIFQFAVARLILGPRFDRDPALHWVTAVLDSAATPREKLTRLFDGMRAMTGAGDV